MLRCLAAVLPLAVGLCAQTTTPTEPTWQRTRAVWFGNDATPTVVAEVGFGWEAVPHGDDAEQAFAGAKDGDRLPLGTAAWATFETFTDCEFGSVKVRGGQYYAALERTPAGWSLALLDTAKVRTAQLLPTTPRKVPAVATIPLAHADGDGTALAAEWQLRDDGARLVLRCGRHTLTADATVQGCKGAFPLAQPMARGAVRLAFADPKDGAQPFVLLDHGQPRWNDALTDAGKQLAPGKRWRLGQDWPTTLETNVPLTIAGKKLAAGSWHLTLAKAKGDGWNLVLSEATADFAARIDGFAPDRVTPVLEVPLRRGKAEATSDTLAIGFVADGKQQRLVITYGDQQLHAPVAAAARGKG